MSRRELNMSGSERFTEVFAYARQDGLALAVKDEKTRAQVLLTDAADMRRLADFLLAEARRIDPMHNTTPALTPDQLT